MRAGWFTYKFLSYIFVREYPLSAVFGVIYLFILVAIEPYILKDFELTGCSEEDLLAMPKFKVELSRVLALNLLCPWLSSAMLS